MKLTELLQTEPYKQIVRTAADQYGKEYTLCQICENEAPQTPWDDWTDDWCLAMRLRTELKEEMEELT